ncbi:MAG TPA: HAD family hydrolase [Polyangiaceae bacterium]|nr:HAD family hydrolase [Polyangiaceae bacterium]
MPARTHVLFDFFGTLVAYSESRVEQGFRHSHELLLELGADIGYAEFLERWAGSFDALEIRAQDSLDEYSMDTVCGQFLGRVLPRLPGQAMVRLFRDVYLQEWNKGVKYIAGVRELLVELAESFTLVLVTNTHHAALVHGHLQAMTVADHFATVVTSVEHGKRKPSACIFERALALSCGQPETSIYVGDSVAADYVGATNAGIRCLLIDPERRHDVPDADRITHILDARVRLTC